MPGKFMVFRRTKVEDPCNSLVRNFRLTEKAIHRKSRQGRAAGDSGRSFPTEENGEQYSRLPINERVSGVKIIPLCN